MARLLAIDFGLKRTGIAVTDVLQLIPHALTTVDTNELLTFLETYAKAEEVEKIIVGQPLQKNFKPSEIEPNILSFLGRLKKKLPDIPVVRFGEQHTSQWAMQSLISSGVKKSERRNKALIDKVSATIILQQYMDAHTNANLF